jgi:hypothetical protein
MKDYRIRYTLIKYNLSCKYFTRAHDEQHAREQFTKYSAKNLPDRKVVIESVDIVTEYQDCIITK